MHTLRLLARSGIVSRNSFNSGGIVGESQIRFGYWSGELRFKKLKSEYLSAKIDRLLMVEVAHMVDFVRCTEVEDSFRSDLSRR